MMGIATVFFICAAVFAGYAITDTAIAVSGLAPLLSVTFLVLFATTFVIGLVRDARRH